MLSKILSTYVQGVAPAPVEEELFENERFMLLRGWSGSHLLPTERRRFTRSSQSFSEFPRIPSPDGTLSAYPFWCHML